MCVCVCGSFSALYNSNIIYIFMSLQNKICKFWYCYLDFILFVDNQHIFWVGRQWFINACDCYTLYIQAQGLFTGCHNMLLYDTIVAVIWYFVWLLSIIISYYHTIICAYIAIYSCNIGQMLSINIYGCHTILCIYVATYGSPTGLVLLVLYNVTTVLTVFMTCYCSCLNLNNKCRFYNKFDERMAI